MNNQQSTWISVRYFVLAEISARLWPRISSWSLFLSAARSKKTQEKNETQRLFYIAWIYLYNNRKLLASWFRKCWLNVFFLINWYVFNFSPLKEFYFYKKQIPYNSRFWVFSSYRNKIPFLSSHFSFLSRLMNQWSVRYNTA